MQADASTSCKRLYILLTVMYLSSEPFEAETEFMRLAAEIVNTALSMAPYIAMMHEHASEQRFHEALKIGRELVAYEETVLARVLGPLRAETSVHH